MHRGGTTCLFAATFACVVGLEKWDRREIYQGLQVVLEPASGHHVGLTMSWPEQTLTLSPLAASDKDRR